MIRNSKPDQLLVSLQGGRAIAAILVAFFHTGVYIFALDKYWGYDPSRHFFDFGHAGVEFFFVLSGFIIFHIHENDMAHPSRFFSYVRKRFIRIYPIYWLVMVPVVGIYFLVPSFGLPYQREGGTILSSFLLVHVNGNSNTELASAWTLYHEILFYSLFSIAIINKRLGLLIISLWLCASATSLIIAPATYSLEFVISPLHLLFAMGIIACLISHRMKIASDKAVALTGLLIFLAAGMEENYIQWLDEMARNLIYGLGSALMLIGVVHLEKRGQLKVPAWLVLTGNASYVIYLINFTVLSLLAKLFIAMGMREALPVFLSYVIMVGLSIIAGIVIHIRVEKPLLRYFRFHFSRRREQIANAAALPPNPIAVLKEC